MDGLEGTGGIRALARRARAHADAVEEEGCAALDATARTARTAWAGAAAAAASASASLGEEAGRRSATALREAADALDAHADEVDRRLALVRVLGDRAASYAHELGGALPDLPPLGDLPWSA